MTVRTPVTLAIITASIVRAFAAGTPFVEFGPDTDDLGRLVLCYRKAGETIAHDRDEYDHEAMETGIFARCPVTSTVDGQCQRTGWAWLRMTRGLDTDELAAIYGPNIDALSFVDRQFIPIACGMQREAANQGRRRIEKNAIARQQMAERRASLA